MHIEYRSFWLFTHVQTLKIDEQSSPTPLKREALVELFLLTKDLRRLDLIDTGLDFVKDLHSVDPLCKSSSADPKGGAPLPHLSEVTLRRVSRYIKGRGPDTLASLVDALLAWIAFRSERGASTLGKVSLSHCVLESDTDLTRLRAAVPVVVWNGMRGRPPII